MNANVKYEEDEQKYRPMSNNGNNYEDGEYPNDY